MKKQFQDVAIQCWQHTGPRLGTRLPCICMQAGPDACERLLEAIDELLAEGPPSRRLLTLKACSRPKTCTSIRLRLCSDREELRQMSLLIERPVANFRFTPSGIAEFRKAVVSWRDGAEDFSVGPDRKASGDLDKASGEVWFWTPFMDP